MQLPCQWAACPLCKDIFDVSNVKKPGRASWLRKHVKEHFIPKEDGCGSITEIMRAWSLVCS